MNVAMLQLNPIVGDFEGNADKVIAAYKDAVASGAELVVGSELALWGYPAQDLLLDNWRHDAHDHALARVVAAVGDVALVVGITVRHDAPGKGVYNSAAFIVNGEIVFVQHKALLPTYDVFDERRYFDPAPQNDVQLVSYRGQKVALLICEDIWGGAETGERALYHIDPVASVARVRPDILITINASPYYWRKHRVRLALLARIARRCACGVVYVNQVGGNDTLVFDGRSVVVSRWGRVLGHGDAYQSGVYSVDTNASGVALGVYSDDGYDALYDALVLGLRDYFHKQGFTRAILGLSGGIDSALAATIAVDALGSAHVRGIGMPSKYSSAGSVDDAHALAEALNIDFALVPIGAMYNAVGSAVAPLIGWEKGGGDVTEENVQARLRGLTLMAVSNRTGALVITTGNKSEIAVGYCTLYGDTVGGFAILSDVPKTLVYELARFRNERSHVIPEATLTKPPSAELAPGQEDSQSLPPYDVLDAIVELYVECQVSVDAIVAHGYERAVVERVTHMINRNEYKRQQLAPGLKVTSRAFGPGRRMPIVYKA